MKHINWLRWNSCLLFVVVMIAICGCKDSSTENRIKRITSRKITLPETVSTQQLQDKPYRAVLWISDKECTRCRINTLPAYIEFYESTRDVLDFFVVISSPDVSIYSQAIADQCLPFPVYFDAFDKFRRLNRHVPLESKYHFFLLDSSGLPMVVGDPVFNSGISQIYVSVFGGDEG